MLRAENEIELQGAPFQTFYYLKTGIGVKKKMINNKHFIGERVK